MATVTFQDNAMVMLLEARSGRRGADRFLLASAILALVAGVGMGVLLDPLTGVGVASVCLLLLFPFFRTQADASALVSFRNGGGLEDLRQTRLTPLEIVDGTAYHCLTNMVRPAQWLTVILVALVVAFAPNPASLTIAVSAAVAFFPAIILVVWAQAYFAQMMSAWTHNNEATGIQFTAVAVVLLPVVSVFPLGLAHLSRGSAVLGVMVFIFSCIWVATISRLGATMGLAEGDQVQRAITKVRKEFLTRNEAIQPWNDNPIVMRECARDSGQVPGGQMGAWVHYNALALVAAALPTGVALVMIGGDSPRAETFVHPYGWYSLMVVFFVAQAARAAARISLAMTEEREKRTLESLAVTPMSIKEFVDGWAEVGWWRRVGESGRAAVCLAVLGWLCGVPTSIIFCLLPLLLLNPIVGAYLGFAVGVMAPNRQESGGDVAVFLTSGVSLGIAAGFLYNGYAWVVPTLWLYGMAFLCLYLSRSLGIRAVS